MTVRESADKTTWDGSMVHKDNSQKKLWRVKLKTFNGQHPSILDNSPKNNIPVICWISTFLNRLKDQISGCALDLVFLGLRKVTILANNRNITFSMLSVKYSFPQGAKQSKWQQAYTASSIGSFLNPDCFSDPIFWRNIAITGAVVAVHIPSYYPAFITRNTWRRRNNPAGGSLRTGISQIPNKNIYDLLSWHVQIKRWPKSQDLADRMECLPLQ